MRRRRIGTSRGARRRESFCSCRECRRLVGGNKRRGRMVSPAPSVYGKRLKLEQQLQAELHIAVAAGPEDRVRAGGVGSLADVAEPRRTGCLGRIDVVRSTRSAGAAKRVDKVDVVENVKELRSELYGEPLVNF